jgi:hypothetical protein
MLVCQARQHRPEPMVLVKDQHTFFIAAGGNTHCLKKEGHAAA